MCVIGRGGPSCCAGSQCVSDGGEEQAQPQHGALRTLSGQREELQSVDCFFLFLIIHFFPAPDTTVLRGQGVVFSFSNKKEKGRKRNIFSQRVVWAIFLNYPKNRYHTRGTSGIVLWLLNQRVQEVGTPPVPRTQIKLRRCYP